MAKFLTWTVGRIHKDNISKSYAIIDMGHLLRSGSSRLGVLLLLSQPTPTAHKTSQTVYVTECIDYRMLRHAPPIDVP